MSDNIEKISSASEESTQSVDRLNSSIEKVNKSLSAIDVGGLEEMEDIISSVNELLNEQKKSLDEMLSMYESLKEEIIAIGEAEEETNETTNDGIKEAIDSVTEFQEGLADGFKGIANCMEGTDKAIFNGMSLVMMFGGAISEATGGVLNLVENWNNMSDMEKGIGIMETATGVMIALASAIALMKLAGAGGFVGILLGGAAIALAIAAFVTSTKQSAESIKTRKAGGGFNTADLFYANEDGNVELVASSNSGGGAVMNMEQLRSAVYDGVFAAMTEGGSNTPGVVMIDGIKAGKLVASSVYKEGKRVGYWR